MISAASRKGAEDVGPLLAAGLEDALVLARRVDAPLALGERERERLLAVDVLARLARLDRRDRVPVLRRGDADGVDVLARDQLAEVGVRVAALVVGLLAEYAFSTRLLACSRRVRVHLADRQRLHVAEPEQLGQVVVVGHLAAADEADGDPLAGRFVAAAAQR